MSKVITVLGEVESMDLGVTYCHEHLIIDSSFATFKVPALKLDSIATAVKELKAFTSSGGKTIVDMMPVGCGRNVEKLAQISRATGVNIIAATGFHKEMYYSPDHWIYRYNVDELTQILTAEITQGIDMNEYTGPLVKRGPIRPGVMKIATDYQCITKTTHKLINAAAAAAVETGLPVSTHTESGTMAEEQLKLLTGYGVKPERILIGHLDRNPDIYVHKTVLESGAFIIYDGPSRVKYNPDSDIIRLIMEMCSFGFEDQIIFGSDLALRSYWTALDGGPGLGYLLEKFLPRLKQCLPEQTITKFMINNPARALAVTSKYN
jgi:predicted metal-dependent phosphotriesterase family hydrolase